ncbi:phosphohydrolase [Streptomyces venezuelae]|uniref:Phosphohydrolase n=1 Tax=Streptomyces venezuelae TaxID=54571 RepID=A0A5P2DUX1_STRVZ|nr:HD domain-containing protein [Streptomyces venezuelae]QES58270.1 phosphohydrolase [Streptomyces venezuelae]
MPLSDALSRALHAPADPPLRALPSPVVDLLRSLDAPPRLAAHLRAVHDVAVQLVDWLEHRHPRIVVDRAAVLFGAATHDIGKTVHTAELSGPGSAHEEAGSALLSDLGFGPDLARFAGTHASWTAPGTTLEDLLVSTADKVWKNKRLPDLEDLVIAHLVQATGGQHWEEYLAFDDLLTRIGDGADGRLAFQASFPAPSRP